MMYSDLYDAFERFCIMAESIGDDKAMEYLKDKMSDELYLKLQVKIWECNNK